MSNEPFPGLRPFRRDETDVFFGRESSLDSMVDKLAEFRFLAITGSSGSGKSSLVFTGLIDALERGLLATAGSDWTVFTFRPGSRPLRALAEALSRAGDADKPSLDPPLLEAILASGPLSLKRYLETCGIKKDQNILIVADQFEEIFRYRTGLDYSEGDSSDSESLVWREQAQALTSLLLESTKQSDISVYVVITLRSDYLGDCAALDGLAEAINKSQFLTPRLTREALRRAIEGPVRVHGGSIEPALVNRLLNEMGNNPDQLPLMQHAMMRLWDISPGEHKNLTLANYEEQFKNIQLALSDHLNALTSSPDLSETQKKLIPLMFRALTEGSGSRNDRRRPTALESLAAICGAAMEDIISIVEQFRAPGRHFLVPQGPLTGTSIIDISHESLIRQWDQLRRWVQTEFSAAEQYHWLKFSADRWFAGQGSLLHAQDLDKALIWRDEEKLNPAWAERYGGQFALVMEFIEKSSHERDAEEGARLKRANRDRRRLYALSLGAVVALACIAMSFVYSHIEDLSARAHNRDEDLLVRAHDRDHEVGSAEYEAAEAGQRLELGDEFGALPLTVDALKTLGLTEKPGDASSGDLNFDLYDRAVREAKTTLLRAFDMETPVLASLIGNQSFVADVAYSPDGRFIATASSDDTVRIWNPVDGFQILPLLECPKVYHCDLQTGVAISPDSVRVASSSWNGAAYVWNLRACARKNGDCNPEVFALPDSPQNPRHHLNGITFSHDGTEFVTASDSGFAYAWKLSDKSAPAMTFGPLSGRAMQQGVDFSRDGKILAIGCDDGTIHLFDAKTAVSIRVLDEDTEHRGLAVNAVAFSPVSNDVLATGSDDGTIRLWNTNSGKLIRVLSGHRSHVRSVAFSPHGDRLVSGSVDRTVRVWDVTTGAQLAVLSGHDNTVFSAVFSPGGDEIVSASQDGTARIWSAKNLSGPTIFCCHFGAVNTARFSPQGDAIVSASNDGSAYILNASDLSSRHRIVLEQPKKIGSVRQPLNSAAFSSHDGKYVVTASLDGHIDVFFRNNGKLSYDTALPQDISFPDHTAYSAIYSPDNRFIAAASADRNVYILDASNGNVVRTLHHQDIVYSAVFSGDTRLIVTTSKDKVTRVWEVSSGKLLAELKGRNRIRWAEFSPEDSKYIVTACDDRFAYLWDWRAKKWIKRFGPHNDLVARASFYWDATAKKLNILTASKDGTVRLWDRDTAEPLKVISIPAGQINFADVPRFGGEVVAAADDGTIRIWSTNNELSLAQELDWAQAASFLLPNNAFRGLGSEQPKPMASSIRTPDQKKRPDLEKAEELKIGMIFAHYQSDLARGPQGRGDARLDEAKLLEEFQKCAKQVVAQTADPAWKTGDPLWRNDMAMLAMRLSVHGKRKQVAEAFEKIEHH